ncbi:MAG: hypothetical protein U0670_02465 [Anaerolineae bacterium]
MSISWGGFTVEQPHRLQFQANALQFSLYGVSKTQRAKCSSMLGIWVNISIGDATAYSEAVMPNRVPAAVKLDLAIPLGRISPLHSVEVIAAVGLAIRGEMEAVPSIPVLIGILAGCGSVSACAPTSNAIVVTALIAFGVPSSLSDDASKLALAAADSLGLDRAALMQFAVLSAHEAQSTLFKFAVIPSTG